MHARPSLSFRRQAAQGSAILDAGGAVRLTDCSGSGLIEKGSIERTIGWPVRLRASRMAPKRTEESSA